jgi:hypothetical protein
LSEFGYDILLSGTIHLILIREVVTIGRPAQVRETGVQTMLTEQQYDLLQEYAQEVNKPLGALVREAVEKSLIIDLEKRRKQKALEWMSAQGLPVDDWEVMERQIESRWEEC